MPPTFYRALAREALRPGHVEKVLDIGCGSGALLARLAAAGTGRVLVGTDLSMDLLRRTRETAERGASLAAAAAAALPFRSGAFDLAILSEVLEHLRDPGACLREVRRILRPSGSLIVTFPNASAYLPFFPIVERALPFPSLRWPFLPWEHPAKTFQPIDTLIYYDEFLDLLRGSGFRIRRAVGLDFFPYLSGGIPGLRRIYRWIFRPAVDRLFNAVSTPRGAYRVVITATPT